MSTDEIDYLLILYKHPKNPTDGLMMFDKPKDVGIKFFKVDCGRRGKKQNSF